MQKDLIDFIVKTLVDDPSAVEVKEVPGDKSVVLELKVKNEDIGKIIGKQGRIAKAMRTILNASASKEGKKYTLEIIE